ncbi:MAG: endonuclease/exonuclease/phosphatase family protein, partial [Bacteroidota bacterium]
FVGWLFLLFFAILSIGIFLAPWLPLSILPWVQVLSPLLPSLSVLYGLILLVFLFRKRWVHASVPALFLLLSFLIYRQNIGPGPRADSAEAEFQVMTYNLGAFYFNKQKAHEVLKLVNESKPDIIAFQEFRNVEFDGEGRAIQYFSEALNLPHYRFVHLPSHVHGVAIFSRFPIVSLDTLYQPKDELNVGIFATLDSPYGRFGIGSLHMSSFQIGTTLRRKRSFGGKMLNLLRQIRRVLYLQDEKYQKIFAKIGDYPYPYVLAGDFNAPSHSRLSRKFRSHLSDSFWEVGQGEGWTFPFRRYRDDQWGMRLDYLYHNEGIEAISCERIARAISDHYPLRGTFRLVLEP